ncbi:MAG TPA: hypothetical protein ENI77_10735 [Nitrospirae bacterium]|nr:hypothetical protein [Nitrospirota bacterium]
MRIEPKLLLSFVFCVCLATLNPACERHREKTKTVAPTRDSLSQHPIYSKYKFNNSENIINIGIQPLWAPTGLITEAIRRDNVLRSALSGLGLSIRLYPFLKGDDVNFFLNRGDLDAGIGGDMPALTAAAAFDVTISSLIQYGYTSIVANHHMLLIDLRGRSIGYAYGSNAHYGLLNALEYEAITKDDVDLLPMDVTLMPESLHKREIFAFSAWEPTPTIALNKYSDMVVIHRSLSTGYLYFRKSFSDKNPQGVRQLIAAEIRAIRWMQEDRRNLRLASQWALSGGKGVSGGKLGVTVEQNVDLAVNDILGVASSANIPKKLLADDGALNKEFRFLKAIGKIPVNIGWERVRDSFDMQTARQIVANQNKYFLNRFKYEAGDNDN